MMSELLNRPFEFELYKAVELINAYGSVEAVPGLDSHQASPQVLFGGHAAYGFVASDIRSITPITLGARKFLRVEVASLGLYGPTSPLAPALNEKIVYADQEGLRLAAFLDVFNHRLIDLWVRVVSRSRFSTNLGHPLPLPVLLMATTGFSRVSWLPTGDHADDGLTDELGFVRKISPGLPASLLRSAKAFPVLAYGRRSLVNLSFLLAILLPRADHRIEKNIPHVLTLRLQDRWFLGNLNSRLADRARLGPSVVSSISSVRLVLTPAIGEVLEDYMPDGTAGAEIFRLLKFFFQGNFLCDWRVRGTNRSIRPWYLGVAGGKLYAGLWLGRCDAISYSIAKFSVRG